MEDTSAENSAAVKEEKPEAGIDEAPPADSRSSITDPNFVENNVIPDVAEASENIPVPVLATKPRPVPKRTKTRPRAPKLTSMPDISDLQLHSPSHIMGTPYTVNSTPFEYPFPPNSQASSPDALFSAPYLLSSLSLSTLPTVAVSTDSPFGPDARSYSATHPKLRAIDPPVPPTLAKKRQRWSLNLPRRGSQTSESSTNPSVTSAETARTSISADDAPKSAHPTPIVSGSPSPKAST